MLCMLLGVGNAWAQSDYSSDYTGNVTLSTTGGTQTNTCKVVLNGTEYSGIKAGTSKVAGAMKIIVPSGTKYLHIHAAGWKGETVTLSVTPSGYSSNIALTSNDGISSNSPFTFDGDASSSDYYKVVTFGTALTNDTELTFSATSGKRFVIWGVTAENESAIPTVATPMFDPASGTYSEAQSVTISCSTEEAAIQYSTDGTNWNTYSIPISVNETTTIQAKATKTGYNDSQVATATYTIVAPITIAAARTQATGSVFTKGVVTSCVGTTGYIQDATAAICVYGTSLTVGDEITVSGTLSTYKGLLEITSPSVTVLSHNNTVTPTIMTIADINATNAPQGKYVKIVEAIVTAIDGQNTTIEQDGASIVVRGISSDVEYAVGDALTLEGNIGCFDVVQIANPQNVEVKKSEKQEAGIAYTTTEYTINLGESFATPTLTNLNNLAVTYESSNTDLATVDENGAVTLVVGATGTTTITASFAGNDTYLPGSASYTLTVVAPNAPGASADNPYTVAQARAAIDAGTGVTGVYATGIVSKIVTAYNATYGNITYNISADGSEEGDQLQAYRGFSYNGENFNSADDIQVGDVVVICGNLKKHNSTYEFDSGNQLVSLIRKPVINAADVTIDHNATSGAINYTIENPVEGTSLTATSEAEWISNIVVDVASITFSSTANEGDADRMATITLTYGDLTKNVTVTQGHYEEDVDFAVLPFEWAGGASADFLALNGISADGLGSDYAAGNAPYLMKLDTTGDYILVKTDSRPGTVTIGVKMLGGANTSTITVQGSADAESFTDVEALTISGAQNTVLTLVTSEDFAENVRFVKLLFTKGSNVGVGPITIEKYTVKQDATVSFKKDGNVITTLEANLNAEIEVAVECDVEGAELNITSSNSRVAKYEDGVVKALAEGEATITATFAGNENYKAATATLVVTVVDNRQDVTRHLYCNG